MDTLQLVTKARSCRRFAESEGLPSGMLSNLVNCARLAPSARNQQLLRYITVEDAAARESLCASLRFAGALKDWDGPAAGERPAGYIIILEPEQSGLMVHVDLGIAAQTIQLAAASYDLASCMFLSFNPKVIASLTRIPEDMRPALVMAVGHPAEKHILESAREGDPLAYWRDEASAHHVPKLVLDDVLIAQL